MNRRVQQEHTSPEGSQGAEADRVERQLDRLEGLAEQLRVAYQRFLNGDAALAECQQIEDQVRIGLRALRHTRLQRSADHFRLGTLEARINSNSEIFHRRVRQIEEGRLPRQPLRSPSSPRFDVERGVVLEVDAPEGAVAALFQGLRDRTGRAPSADLGSFRAYLEKQISAIREKTGCRAVQFRLVSEEGKVKLKARPVSTRSATT